MANVGEVLADMPGNNFISRFDFYQNRWPLKKAIVFPQASGSESITSSALAREAAFWQQYLQERGLVAGDHVVVAVPPGILLYSLVTALLAAGMVPVFIDGGMGRKKVREALQDARPAAAVSVIKTLRWFWLIPELRRCQRYAIDGCFPGVTALPLEQAHIARSNPAMRLRIADVDTHAHGLISFTSGSTGRPKGADRTHYSLHQQHLAIRSHWPDAEDDVDCPCFPVMVLHNLSCGMTSVLPAIDFAAPGTVSNDQAAATIALVDSWEVTRFSGAPAYMNAISDYLLADKRQLTNVRSVIVGGATVSRDVAEKIKRCFPNAYSRIAYGSTEAEPVAAITLEEYLATDSTQGYLVGEPVSCANVTISCSLPLVNATEQDVVISRCNDGECGEILVAGRHVLRGYINHPMAEAQNKIPRDNDDEPVWHRTGDTGFFDEQGRLWLTGRTRDLIYGDHGVLQPLVIEQQIDALAGVQRSALIQWESGELALYLQTEQTIPALLPDIRPVLVAAGIAAITLLRIEKMPLDSRHNSKIDRPLLREYSHKIQLLEKIPCVLRQQ